MGKRGHLIILALATRTATVTNSDDQESNGAKGVYLSLDINTVSGTSPTLNVKVQRKDPISGNYVDITGGAFAERTGSHANSTFGLTIYPTGAAQDNLVVPDVLGLDWRVVATIGGTDTPTFAFSVAGVLVP